MSMFADCILKNALIVNEGASYTGSVVISSGKIEKILKNGVISGYDFPVIDLRGKWLLPGVIDTHVHFRDPGLTQKADISSESRAAIAGGVTSFLDMPNTKPQTVTIKAWQDKMDHAADVSYANYGFYLGATNDNFDELEKADFSKICGVKVFMGSSTGNMLVDNEETLKRVFSEIKAVVAIHAESEPVIRANREKLISELGEHFPVSYHPVMRSEEACYKASSKAVALAKECGTRLHLLHISTEKELGLFSRGDVRDKLITAETCPSYLYFDDSYYDKYGAAVKCNPAIKTVADKEALRKALADDVIDVIGTDHAPHLWQEKQGDCLSAVSGLPSIQFSLPLMLELALKGVLTKEQVVKKMCHAPADLFRIHGRGYIREGYFADFVVVDPAKEWTLCKQDILSKCNWSPYENMTFHTKVCMTFVNGFAAYDAEKGLSPVSSAKSLVFG